MTQYHVQIGFTRRQLRTFRVTAESPTDAEERMLAALRGEGGTFTFVSEGLWDEDPDVYVSDVTVVPTLTTEDRIAQAKQEILADIESGVVPESVATFSELHDYVDANWYGGLFDVDFDPASADDVKLVHDLQEAVHTWLAAGRPDDKENHS